MKRKLFIAVFSLFFCSFCYAQSKGDTDYSPVTLRLNLGEANGASEKDVFDEVSFIPLETNSNSLFGRISQLEVTDDYFIILDGDTNSILFFNKSGKFRNKIKGGNKSVNPRKIISKFIINRYKKEILFKTLANDFYYVYDFNCVKKETIAIQNSKFSNNMEFLSKENFVASNNYGHTGDSVKSFLSFFKNNDNYSTSLPYTNNDYLNGDVRSSSGNSDPFYFYGNDTTLFYTKPYDYNIYAVSSKSTKVAYHLVFTMDNALPANFLKDSVYSGKRVKFLQDHPEMVFAISNCYKLGNKLLFKANNSDNNFKTNYMYDVKAANLVSFDKITPDELSYYLPIAYDGLDYRNNGLAACEGGYVYTDISAMDLLNSFYDTKNKRAEISGDLAGFFKRNDKQSNPVIIKLHLKN